MSIRNEKKVLNKIKEIAIEAYEKYPHSLEEDLEILAADDSGEKSLTFNERNCVLYRSGEKKILRFLIKMAEDFLPLLDMSFKEARKTADKLEEIEVCRDYLNHVILYLIKKGL